jgi:hypothetical protein
MSLESHFRGLYYPEFFDSRGGQLSLTPTEINEMAGVIRSLGKRSKLGRTAVLVADDATFGVVRMLEMSFEDFCEVRPFRDEQEARVWLTSKTALG